MLPVLHLLLILHQLLLVCPLQTSVDDRIGFHLLYFAATSPTLLLLIMFGLRGQLLFHGVDFA